MSTDYRFEKEITFKELFDGRLERFGIYEKIIEGQTSSDCRLLIEGPNGMLAYGDEVLNVITRFGTNNPVNILNAITETFDTYVFSEYEPQFWGFETEEEWDRAESEMHTEGQAKFYIEIMKFVRGEPNDITPGTNGEKMGNIAKIIINANPDLASPDKAETLMEMINQEYMENHAIRVSLTEKDIAEKKVIAAQNCRPLYIESLKQKGLIEASENPCQEGQAQARQSWLEIKSREIAEFTGCSDEDAWYAAESAGDAHILPGYYTLNFKGLGWVSVTEMLFDAELFDQETLTDPICYSTNLFVATFEWNDGDPLIRSFHDGECVYAFLPAEVDVADKYHALQNALTDVGTVEWGREETLAIINLLYGDRYLT